jgi:hypothetical protein
LAGIVNRENAIIFPAANYKLRRRANVVRLLDKTAMDASSIPTPATDNPPPEPSSLTDRLTNVIAAPGEAFGQLKNMPVRTSNWIVPLILSCIATVIYICVAFSQPAILQGVNQQRIDGMQKRVAAQKMTQAQADQANAWTEAHMTATVMKILGAGGGVLAEAAGLFLMGLGVWLFSKWFTSARLGYMKVVEVCGLALIIDVPQKIIRILLVSWKQNLLATASPTLFLDNPSTASKHDLFLSFIDVVDIWWLAVLSLGLSKVASISYRAAAFICFGVWFGFRIISTLLGSS